MQLVGVSAGSVHLNGQDYPTQPSEQLLYMLSNLPDGTRVGLQPAQVEISPEFRHRSEMSFDRAVMAVDTTTVDYWNAIFAVCEKENLRPVWLKSDHFLSQSAEQTVESFVVRAQLTELLKQHPFKQFTPRVPIEPGITQKVSELRRRLYHAEKSSDYYDDVSQCCHTIDVLVGEKPEVALVYDRFGDYFLGLRRFFADQGVRIKKYLREEPVGFEETTVLPDGALPNVEMNLVLKQNVSHYAMAQRFLLRRKAVAALSGRVTLGEMETDPDYIGTITPDLPAMGLFELRVEEKYNEEFVGTLEDLAGKSTVFGTIKEQKLSFMQEYDVGEGIGVPDALFTGEFNDSVGRFEGLRYEQNASDSQLHNVRNANPQRFWMRPFAPGLDYRFG